MNKYYPNGSKRDNSYELFEKDEWYYGKGFRNFWGMPIQEFGFENIDSELTIFNLLIKSIDKSLEGLPKRFKVFEIKKGQLKFLAGQNGIKFLVSNLLKHYVNNSILAKNENNPLIYEKVPVLTHSDSPKQVVEVAIVKDFTNKNWANKIVDWVIDKEDNTNT